MNAGGRFEPIALKTISVQTLGCEQTVGANHVSHIQRRYRLLLFLEASINPDSLRKDWEGQSDHGSLS